MVRPPHSKKEVEEALRYMEAMGWRVQPGGSHAWGAFTVRITTMTAGAANSASPASGVPPKIREIMRVRFDESRTTAPRMRSDMWRRNSNGICLYAEVRHCR